MRELYRNDYFVMTVDEVRWIVCRARTERRFESLELVERVYDEVGRSLDILDRRKYVVLVDVRLAPPRNDPAYEQLITRYEGRLYNGFRRIAFLAKTEAGRLQITRLFADSALGERSRAFTDEAAARAYLEATDTSPPSARRSTRFT
jgi:hypothetical protein